MNVDPLNVLRQLKLAGIEVRAELGDLVLCPADRLTEELVEMARSCKPDLLDLVTARTRYATAEGDPRPAYGPADDPPPPPDTPDEAGIDMLILSYGLGRRARALAAMGERCPAHIAEQVRGNLEPVAGVL